MKVAVIDIGSNSIKALVAESLQDGSVQYIFNDLIETRISEGISAQSPLLTPKSILEGIKTIAKLWKNCLKVGPIDRSMIVATSAVRSASNGQEFVDKVFQETGLKITVLTGNQEAEAIAMGATQDPQLKSLASNYSLFDLGGGSVEFIAFGNHKLQNRISLPLGAVRLTERLIQNPSEPLSAECIRAFKDHVHTELIKIPFPLNAPLVGMGGGISVLKGLVRKNPIPLQNLQNWTRKLTALPLEERIKIPTIPTKRADILPAALLTFECIVEIAKANEIYHSNFNLRYGLAHQLLIQQKPQT